MIDFNGIFGRIEIWLQGIHQVKSMINNGMSTCLELFYAKQLRNYNQNLHFFV